LAQFFATISGDSVAFAGATGVSPEQAHNSAANRTTNPNLIGRLSACRNRIETKVPHSSAQRLPSARDLDTATLAIARRSADHEFELVGSNGKPG
jgi:hypothetical protein